MNLANLLTIGIFALTVLSGAAWVLWNDWRTKNRPEARIRARILDARRGISALDAEVAAQLERARMLAQRRRLHARLGPRFTQYVARFNTIGGRAVTIRVGVGTIVGTLLGIILISMVEWYGLTEFTALIVCSLIGLLWSYRLSVRRFEQEFRKQLPDAIDMVRRASRAGIPPMQALRTVGEDLAAPLGPEFRAIGDALFLGDDLDEVLDGAAERIRIAEFSFFTVFLKTQRSTGGSMSETLENLAGVLRDRAQLDLKVKAMTSEGRIMSWTMAALPFFVLGMLLVVNREYALIMFTTDLGRSLLVIAAIMLVVGLLIIQRLARLEG